MEGAAFEPGVCFEISPFCPAIFSTISNQPPSSHGFHTITPKMCFKTTRHYHIYTIPHKANIVIPNITNNTFRLASRLKHPPRVPSHLPQSSTSLRPPNPPNIRSTYPNIPSETPPFGARSYLSNNTDTRDCSQGPLTRVLHDIEQLGRGDDGQDTVLMLEDDMRA